MTAHDDHGTLPSHAATLLNRLEELRGRFAPAETSHMQHMEYAQRAALLADMLRGSWAAAADTRYAAALVVTRSALEHHLLDRLLFLANRWVQSWGVKATDVAAEEKRLAGLKAGPRPDIARWWHDPRTGDMNVVIRGLFPEASRGRGATVSPYYFRVDQYDPFIIGGRLTGKLARGFADANIEERWAKESQREWHGHFTYERLRANLDVNRLLVPRLGVQVGVHYAFLSAFVHPAQRGYDLLYGSNIPSRMGQRDHYCEELVLLYLIAVAAAELEAFGRMSRRKPALPLLDWEAVEREVAEARLATEYFWFLSGDPHQYDRIEEVHTRVWRRRKWGPPDIDWRALPAERVRYYPNPLERLVRMHHTTGEMSTGLVFQSPFDRSDAAYRW